VSGVARSSTGESFEENLAHAGEKKGARHEEGPICPLSLLDADPKKGGVGRKKKIWLEVFE